MIWTTLDGWDRQLTLWLGGFNSPWSDAFWQFFSQVRIWFPFYILAVIFLFWRLGWKRGLTALVVMALAVTCCDQLCNLVKDSVARLRPCDDPLTVGAGLHILEAPNPAYPYGFFSAHAANSFVFAFASLRCLRWDRRRRWRGWGIVVFLWAFLVSVSRVFVAKHYLGDVLVGAAAGCLIAWLFCLAGEWMNRKVWKVRPWDLVIFDLDGTMLDTLPDLAAAVDYALAQQGRPGLPMAEYRRMVGNGVRKLVARALGMDDEDARLKQGSCEGGVHEYAALEDAADRALKDFRAYYTAHIDIKTQPYPGMPRLLRRLTEEGIPVAVVSNKFLEGTVRLMNTFFPDIPFTAVLGEGATAASVEDAPSPAEGGSVAALPLKPAPDLLYEAMRRSGVKPSGRVVMVGDAYTDIRSGRNAGCTTVGVSWGFRPRAQLVQEKAGYVADLVADLERILL